jgi:hypothetical protein
MQLVRPIEEDLMVSFGYAVMVCGIIALLYGDVRFLVVAYNRSL